MTIPFFCNAGDYDDNFSFYIYPYITPFETGEKYLFSTTTTQARYIGESFFSGSKYADIYAGPVGSSTLLGGHSIGTATDFDLYFTDYLGNPADNDLFFAVIYDATKLTQFRAYFTTGGSPPSEDYAIISFYYGPETIESSYIWLNYPGDNETVASTSVDLGANYWNIDNYTTGGFKLQRTDNIFNTIYLESSIFDGQGSISTTTILLPGAYSYQAYIKNETNITYSDSIFNFYVLYNPYANATTTEIDTDFNCDDLGTIAGAFCSVLVKLFKPDPENLRKFASLDDLLKEKPPLSYFYQIKAEYDNLGASTTPAFALQQVASINNNVFGPLKTGLGWLLWLVFGIYAIKRISHYNL